MKKSYLVSAALAAILLSGCGEGSSSSDEGTTPAPPPAPAALQKAYVEFIGSTAEDVAQASAFDSANNLYVVGYTEGNLTSAPNAGKKDMFLRKLDENGSTLCTFQYGTTEDDVALDVAADSADNIYVTGWTKADFDGHTYSGEDSTLYDGGDIFIMKFDADCQKLSSALFGSAGNDNAKAISIDSNDNVFVAGEVRNGSLNSQTQQGTKDYFVMKLDTNLNESWTTQFGSSGSDTLNDIVVDNNGSLYIGGYLDSDISGYVTVQGGDDGYVAKYDAANGNLSWITSITDTDSASYDEVFSLALTSTQDIIAGYHLQNSGVALVDKNSTLTWQKDLDSFEYFKVAVDSSDNIYVGSAHYTYDTTIYKLNSSGEEIFHAVFDPIASNGYVAIEDLTYNPNDGYVYAVGASEDDFNAPYTADNNHTGGYDGVVVKFK